MTYYQKKRVIAKLKRIRNHIKYNELDYGETAVVYGLMIIDVLAREHVAEPCTVGRGKPLPKRF